MKSFTTACLLSIVPLAVAQSGGVLEISRETSRISTTAPAENFTGSVHVEMLFAAKEPGRTSGGTVTFAPGARTGWHTHPIVQVLIVTAGIGRVQQWGGEVQEIRLGDVVRIPEGVKHWHGAAPDSAMTHIAITEQQDGKAVEWMEKVTDAEYGASMATAAKATPMTPSQASSETLSATQQAIPLIASFMAAGDMPKLNGALNQGLDAGLTISEAKEILVQLYAYAGFPKSLNALGELLKVMEARKQRGIQDSPGREPSRSTPTGDALVVVGKANQTRISGGPVQGPVFDFAPIINTFLQAHLFGDIFERDNLDWQSRELATLGALAATPGVEEQLRSHMGASLRVGLSSAQLRQLVKGLAERGDAAAAKRAEEAFTKTLSASGI
jgi:quercetin dioxygenase-like cupin family protein